MTALSNFRRGRRKRQSFRIDFARRNCAPAMPRYRGFREMALQVEQVVDDVAVLDDGA
jgi:hypothetical protein